MNTPEQPGRPSVTSSTNALDASPVQTQPLMPSKQSSRVRRNIMIVASASIISTLMLAAYMVHDFERRSEVSPASSATQNEVRDQTESNDSPDDVAPQVIRRQEYTVTLPAGFRDMPAAYTNADMDLAKGDPQSNTFAVIIHEPRSDFNSALTLEQYVDLIRDNVVSTSGVTIISHELIRNGIIGNPRSYQVLDYRDTAEVDGMKVVYYNRYIMSDTHLFQFVTWTTPSREEKNKQLLIDIIESITIGNDVRQEN